MSYEKRTTATEGAGRVTRVTRVARVARAGARAALFPS